MAPTIARLQPALLLLAIAVPVGHSSMPVADQDETEMTQPLLERLEAEAACLRLLHAYGRAVDWQDETGLTELFWPDAQVDLGFFKGTGPEAVAFLMANAAASERRFHATSNAVLDIAGDQAQADSCCITHAVGADEQGLHGWQIFFGRYLDRLERRNGEWRFAERRFVLNFHHSGRDAESPLLAAVPRAARLDPQNLLFRFR